MTNYLIAVEGRDLNTILAALRHWQATGQCDRGSRSAAIDDIARGVGGDDEGESLSASDVDALCERLNCDSYTLSSAVAASNLSIGAWRDEVAKGDTELGFLQWAGNRLDWRGAR